MADEIYEVYTSRLTERTDSHDRISAPLETAEEKMALIREVGDVIAKAWDAGFKLQIDYKV